MFAHLEISSVQLQVFGRSSSTDPSGHSLCRMMFRKFSNFHVAYFPSSVSPKFGGWYGMRWQFLVSSDLVSETVVCNHEHCSVTLTHPRSCQVQPHGYSWHSLRWPQQMKGGQLRLVYCGLWNCFSFRPLLHPTSCQPNVHQDLMAKKHDLASENFEHWTNVKDWFCSIAVLLFLFSEFRTTLRWPEVCKRSGHLNAKAGNPTVIKANQKQHLSRKRKLFSVFSNMLQLCSWKLFHDALWLFKAWVALLVPTDRSQYWTTPKLLFKHGLSNMAT